MSIYSKIIGSGSYIPEIKVANKEFLKNTFYNADGSSNGATTHEVIEKFYNITGIEERRYAREDQKASDLAFIAASRAIESSGIDKESLDYILVAHNFGDVSANTVAPQLMPSLAARVKHLLKIENPKTIAYDILFGCPGWVQAMIQANYFIKSGDAKRVLVIGSETLSRVCDPHDRDSMIYADGAGATILEGVESDTPTGILSHSVRTDTLNEAYLLWSGASHNPEFQNRDRDFYIKMQGNKIYQYVISNVPQLVKECIEKAGLGLKDIKKILIHQANEKMDEAVAKRLFRLYGEGDVPNNMMPMIIKKMGNNSVATVPILYDMIAKGKLEGHNFTKGDHVVFASVGAGMSINAFVYQF
ncbi:3-oxoacyl-ACP synthase III family protein [Ancylomarina sp. 16SWW S1-10-2]|uniref:3-oxoacyl-ACP synthase III family protein n=1 Tax=Ancylomarina sp. 16SWW S1-10-2 TaxID=2499681 RepID=UPI0012AE73CE|nr:ketoacyl-ACP synthase III [Ancylomarina sp. 16SWW S1-10-2]MRT93080.1 ketoacyl-ACP synthase III [Ancylomarina sp. 16SWW S1-10-2]